MNQAIMCLPLALVLMAASPAPVALALPPTVGAARAHIVADALKLSPTALVFDRTTSSVRKGGGSTTKTVKVERWDGKRWVLVTLNGRKPTAAEREVAEKMAAALPVPGYHRLGQLIAAATDTTTDAQGRTVLKVPVLPAGSVRTDGGDISNHLKAEVMLSSRDGQPWVEQVRVSAREPFRMNMLIKVVSFEQVSDYRLDAGGLPRLERQSADSVGTMFGFSGGEKSEVTYAYR